MKGITTLSNLWGCQLRDKFRGMPVKKITLYIYSNLYKVGIRTMTKNEKAHFLIDHTYGYGRFGCPPRIPEQATILGIISNFDNRLSSRLRRTVMVALLTSSIRTAMVEVVDFVEEGQADAFLALDIIERNKKYTYPEIEKVREA